MLDIIFVFQAEDGIRDLVRSRGLGDVYKRQVKHSVRYNSLGEKYISLTIITDIGCQITEIRRIYVEPCCEDLPTLRIGIDSTRNLSCFESNDGMIAFNGNQGTPFDEDINGVKSFYYQYSLNGQDFSPTSRFINLPAGTLSLIHI